MFLGLGGLIGLSTCRLRPEDLAWPYMSRTCFDWYKDPEKKYTPPEITPDQELGALGIFHLL